MMETFSTGQSPFREVIDTTRFFPGGNRREMLESLKSALRESVSLIILTGDEGSGKTMICRMIEQELPGEYILVFFSDMLESFEDVSRAIAQEMKITLADGIAVGDIRELLFEVWERLSENKQRMLLVFDQAERIYLATLERIRKMLDVVNQTEINFQILLSGRDDLLDNLEQLSMCNFQGAEERQFVLEPLDTLSTYAYLNFCMKAQGDDEVFSLEASEKIFSIAGGNIRKTNLLANDSLKSMTADSSFMVLLDNVRDTLVEEQPARRDFSFLKVKYRSYKKWLIPAGAALMVLVLILILRIGRSPTTHVNKPAPELEKLSAEFRNIQKKEEEIERRAANMKDESRVVEQEKAKDKSMQAAPASPSLKVEDITIKKSPVVKSSGPGAATSAAGPQITKPVNTTPEKPVVSEQERMERVEKIFDERTAAAAKWLVGRQNNHYTIQLMVLASVGAENNLKKMLAKKEYQDLADKLYILRRAASSPTILVFFGEYPTMVDARNARKDLPEFLLKHNPYAISIRGAIEKAIGG
jgi:type II secretory pathway predicted ATPase ExeA